MIVTFSRAARIEARGGKMADTTIEALEAEWQVSKGGEMTSRDVSHRSTLACPGLPKFAANRALTDGRRLN